MLRHGAGRPARNQPYKETLDASYMGGVAVLPLALLMAITGMAGSLRSALPSGVNNRRSYAIWNG